MVRFRKLTGHADWSQFGAVYAHENGSGMFGGRRAGAFDAAVAAANLPRNVTAREGQASAADVEQMLRTGQLNGRDLVFEDGAWIGFAESMQFGDVCDHVRAKGSTTKWVLIAFALVIACLVGVWLYRVASARPADFERDDPAMQRLLDGNR